MPGILGGLRAAGGGGNLGNARGSIEIDTSQLNRVSAQVNRVGRDIRQSFDQSLSGVQRFSAGVKELRNELRAVGVMGGLLTAMGVRDARAVRRARVSFEALLGTEAEAVELMSQLTEASNEFGLEITSAWTMARNILPILEGGTEELDEWVLRAARLNSLDPAKTTTDAARALQEYIADQPLSLQRLFNVPPSVIREAKQSFDDLGQQMDFILDEMGATEEAARRMADSFVSVRNEIVLMASVGFGPFFEMLQNNLPHLRRFMQHIRETHPAILRWGAAFAIAAVTAAPMLLFLQRMISLMQTLQAMGVLSALAGLGATGGAVGIGAILGTLAGIGTVRGIGQVTGDEKAKGYGLGDIAEDARANWQRIMTALREGLATQLAKYAFEFEELRAGIEEVTLETVLLFQKVNLALAKFTRSIYALIPGQRAAELTAQADTQIEELQASIIEKEERLASVRNDSLIRAAQLVKRIYIRLGVPIPGWEPEMPMIMKGGTAPQPAAPSAETGGYNEEQMAAIQQWADQVLRIEEQFGQRRTQITEQYESQRTSIISNYERMIAREAEDWARQRTRAQRRLQRNITDIRENQARQEAEWQADLNERIAEIRSDGAERIEELQESHNLRMEQMQRDHRVTLMEAASRLDARAVAEEQRRYRNQVQDAEQNLERRIEQEQENQQERIEQAREAHRERVQDARRANERRIADLRETFEEQRRIAEEDRAVRLQRMEEDHERQLDELDRAHDDQLRALKEAKADELRALNRSFGRQLRDLGIHTGAMEGIQKRHQRYSERLFENYWGNVHRAAIEHLNQLRNYVDSYQPPPPPSSRGEQPYEPYLPPDEPEDTIPPQDPLEPPGGRQPYEPWLPYLQHGGLIDRTGLAVVHRNEYVIPADITSALSRAVRGRNLQAGLAPSGGGGGISVGEINIPITAAPGMDAQDVGVAVRDELYEVFEELASE